MVWFEVIGGLEAGKVFMKAVELWSLAENLGIGRVADHPSHHHDARRR
jgi:hypothetical protein